MSHHINISDTVNSYPAGRETFGTKYVLDWIHPKWTYQKNIHCIYVQSYNPDKGLRKHI